jgi:hypothetical protein
MSVVIVVALLALHAFSLFGFGRLMLRHLGSANRGFAMSVAIGLAAVVVLGGVLNLLRAAASPSPQIVVGIGAALGIAAVPWKSLPARQIARSELVPYGLLVALALVLCAAILPTPTFNYYDDLQKYFAHPVRMLQTGTVFGSSLSAMGFETLGGQAYLHGFVLGSSQLDMLHAVDSVFAFLLVLALLARVQTKRSWAKWIALSAAAAINPQIVNVSATYTAAALATALVLLALEVDAARRGSAVLAGLCLAALCALKSSLCLYALALGLALGAAQLASTRFADAARWSLGCVTTTAVCLAPWILVHLPHLLLIAEHRSPPASPSLAAAYSIEPFSWQSWGYGTGFAAYTYAVLALLVLAALAVARTRPRSYALHVSAALSVTTAVLYATMLYVIGPVSQGELTMLRLFAPMLIGVFPAAYVLVAESGAWSTRRDALLVGVLGIAPLLSFVSGAVQRAERALVQGSVFVVASLDDSPSYRALNRYMLHGPMQQQVRTAQAAIPAGEAFVAWIGAPFWLDFRRNPITDLDLAGLETPWAKVPDTHYMLWEFGGRTTPQLAGFESVRHSSGAMSARTGEDGLRLTHALLALQPRPKVRWNDGQFLVLELDDVRQLRETYLSTRTDAQLETPVKR